MSLGLETSREPFLQVLVSCLGLEPRSLGLVLVMEPQSLTVAVTVMYLLTFLFLTMESINQFLDYVVLVPLLRASTKG